MVSTPRLAATDAARLAGMSYLRMVDYLRAGEIVGEQRGRDWWVDREALDRWISDLGSWPALSGRRPRADLGAATS